MHAPRVMLPCMLDCVAHVRLARFCGQRALHAHANEPIRQAAGDTPMLHTNGQAHGTTHALMFHAQIPVSKVIFKLYGMEMKAYRSADGKRLMSVALDFVSIVNKKHDQNEYAKSKWPKLKQSCSVTTFNADDLMDIPGLKALLYKLPYTRDFPKHNADPYRRDILSTLTAFENGNTSMIEDLGPMAAWPADTPFSGRLATYAPINTTNRQAAAASTPSARIHEIIARASYASYVSNGASASYQPADKTSRINPVHVSGLLALNPGPLDKSNSKEVLPQRGRQKMVATMRAFPGQEAISAAAMPSISSSAASPFSTPSVAESVEFTETNPKGIDAMEQEAPPMDQDASGDPGMNDTESDSEKEQTPAAVMEKEAPASEQQAPVDNGMPDATDEISTGANFALFMAQVCFFFFLFQDHHGQVAHDGLEFLFFFFVSRPSWASCP